jgi:hypothetical protein
MGVMWIGAYPYLTGTHTGRPLISFGAAGETEATNALYTMVNVSSVDDSMHDFWEQGAGVNVTPISDYSISMGNAPTHYAAVRSVSGGVATLSYYVDGRLFFSTTGWTAPTGGDDGVFKFGADHIEGNKNIGYAASVAVFDYAPDLAQVEAAYNLTLGPVKGTI